MYLSLFKIYLLLKIIIYFLSAYLVDVFTSPDIAVAFTVVFLMCEYLLASWVQKVSRYFLPVLLCRFLPADCLLSRPLKLHRNAPSFNATNLKTKSISAASKYIFIYFLPLVACWPAVKVTLNLQLLSALSN